MAENSEQQNKDSLRLRPPIVVVLGHVDHGKTSILDYIRKSHVAEKESGGITQHIGAYEIKHNEKNITFIDTPGHEAFSAMRSRGAKVADMAILVVSVEEGVKPQTKEAIAHIKKAGIPFIVAINKVDKPQANPEKIKRELAQQEILVESMGGNVPSVETSTKTGQGIEDLLELILLLAEMQKLEADAASPAQGLVVESYLDSQRGPTATLLLRNGILKKGDIIGTATAFGKTKVLDSFQGSPIEEALPSMPVVVIGFEKVPQVGEKFMVYVDLESAQKYIEKKEKKAKARSVFFAEEGKKVLNFILKADVQGSIEAIGEVLKGLPQEKVALRILNSQVGEVGENDVKLAKSGKAQILGFRVKVNESASVLAERDNIKIMIFDIIYDLAQQIRQIMEKAETREKIRIDLGEVKVLSIFLTEKNRQIVGCKVTSGQALKGVPVEVFRNEEKVGEGRIINLQKNKKNAEKAIKGEECGILYQGEMKLAVGDRLALYQISNA